MKKPLLLLHGAFHSATQLSTLKNILSADYAVHSPDLPGHGSEARQGKLSMHDMATAIANYISTHHLQGCICFGYSMGGYAALVAEAGTPGLFSGVFTLATKYQWSPEIAAKEAGMLHAPTIKEKLPAFAGYLENTHGSNWVNLSEQLADMLKDLGNTPLLDAPAFAKLNLPVRVAVGDKDRMVGLEETIQTYRALPNCSLQVLPNTPHPLDRVNMEILASEIGRFAQSLPG